MTVGDDGIVTRLLVVVATWWRRRRGGVTVAAGRWTVATTLRVGVGFSGGSGVVSGGSSAWGCCAWRLAGGGRWPAEVKMGRESR
nr:hypothetical protein [Tanacetum cinerariifolium]